MNDLFDDNENLKENVEASNYKHAKADDLATNIYDNTEVEEDIDILESVKNTKDLHENTILDLYASVEKNDTDGINIKENPEIEENVKEDLEEPIEEVSEEITPLDTPLEEIEAEEIISEDLEEPSEEVLEEIESLDTPLDDTKTEEIIPEFIKNQETETLEDLAEKEIPEDLEKPETNKAIDEKELEEEPKEDKEENMASFLYDKDYEEAPKRRQRKETNKKMKLWQKLFVIIICLFIAGGSGLAFLLYGPYPNFREWLITTAMTTMNHQYLAKWFYSDKTIDNIMKKNYVVETNEEVDTSQVKFVDYSNLKVMYKNKYEKEILTKDKNNDLYKLININEDGMRGYLVVIYDPSKVKVATATNMSSYGEMLTDMVKKNNAIIGMNASGFYDPGYNGNGGKPYGIVIKNSKVVSNLEKPNVGGGIIGFTKENKLILGKMSANEAINKGIRDAVEFGPYLIVNGKPSFIRGNGGWGTAPRSAIAQRQDGIVLFLVMDGRDYSHGIDGVGMVELTEILMKYGAYNASNLDGGTSCGLVIGDKLINKPVNGSGQKKTRKIPDSWIVTK
ncbi:MAG: phosphodiester glycosidase family protein [Bacilli bacterium]|nr:phosphodiester glycosidase family protein [Bacilli bacterium]